MAGKTLGHDFAAVRNIVFPGDKRSPDGHAPIWCCESSGGRCRLAAKLANSIGRSNALHKTYAPVDIEAVRNTDAARLRGRQRMRAENESRAKVSKTQSGRVSNN